MGTVRNLWRLRRAHLRYQQGELLQPVMKVVAVGQTGLDCGGAVSPAHQQPHGVVSHWRETETGETAFFLCIRSICVCFRSYCDYLCVEIQNNERQMLTRIIFRFLPSWRDLWSDCAFRTLLNKSQRINETCYISNTR